MEKEKPWWMQIIIRIAATKSLRGSFNFRLLLGKIGSANQEDCCNYNYNFTKTSVPDYDPRLCQWAGLVGAQPMEVDMPPAEHQGDFEVIFVGQTGPQQQQPQQPQQPQMQPQEPQQPQPRELQQPQPQQREDDPMLGNGGAAAGQAPQPIGGVALQAQAAQLAAQHAAGAANAPPPAVRGNTRLAQRPDGTMRLTNIPATPVCRQRQAANAVAATPTQVHGNIPQSTFPVNMLCLANHRDAVCIGQFLCKARQSNCTVTCQEIVNLGIGTVVAKKDVLSVLSVALSTCTAKDEDEEEVDVERPSGALRGQGRPPGATSRAQAPATTSRCGRSAARVILDVFAAIPAGSQAIAT